MEIQSPQNETSHLCRTSGDSLVSQIQICPAQSLRLSTYNAIIDLRMPDETQRPVCVFLEVNSSSILVFMEPVTKPVGITFVRVNGSDVTNSFSVVLRICDWTVDE